MWKVDRKVRIRLSIALLFFLELSDEELFREDLFYADSFHVIVQKEN